MTVHSLPNAGSAVSSAQRTGRGRWKMFGVLAVCAAPVVASYFTYYVVRPEGRHNFGELIEPQRPVPALNVLTMDGATVPMPSLRGQWLLVSVAGGNCEASCQNHLYLQRQLRESLGKDKERIDWLWLVDDDGEIPVTLQPALSQATVLRANPEAVSAWLAPAEGKKLADHLYVVDPMGNWMMRFPAALDAAGASKAKRDLARLLRASSSWDNAGRPSVAP